MNTKHSGKTPRTALLLLAFCLAVLFCAGVLLQTAAPRDNFKLTVTQGDAEALQGFTFQGTTHADACASMRFTLQDGTLTSKADLSHETLNGDEVYYSFNTLYTPTKEARAAAAQEPAGEYHSRGGAFFLTLSRYSGEIYSIEAKGVSEMLTISINQTDEAPSGTTRIELGRTTLPQPIPMQGETTHRSKGTTAEDYSVGSVDLAISDSDQEQAAEQDALVDFFPSRNIRCISEYKLFAWDNPGQTATQYPAGVYRLTEMLTEEQVQALPKEGTVGDVPVLLYSQPYGAVEQVFALPEEATLIALYATKDSILALYSNGGEVCITTSDHDGQNLHTTVLEADPTVDGSSSYGDMAYIAANRADEVAFTIYHADTDRHHIFVFRLQAGSIVAQKEVTCTSYTGPELVMMDEAGQRVLVGARQYNEIPGLGELREGYQLTVWDGDTCTMTANLDMGKRTRRADDTMGFGQSYDMLYLNTELAVPDEKEG